jgi:hypothetical protein
MKAYGGVPVQIHIFLTSALVGGEWSASRHRHFDPRERAPGTHWIGGWVGPRASLDDMEKKKFLTVLGLKLQPLLLSKPIAIAILTTLSRLPSIQCKGVNWCTISTHLIIHFRTSQSVAECVSIL